MFVLVVNSVMFVHKCEAAWPAKQHVGVEDSEIDMKL